jgi:DNA-binding NarL/FixJ family response regulator
VTVRVLILDDNKALREKLQYALGHVNGDSPAAVCFDNMADLIESYKRGRPDFTFIRLGDTLFSGLSAAHELKEVDSRAKVFFISQSRDYAVYAFSAGATGYLLEPIDEDKLNEVLYNDAANL